MKIARLIFAAVFWIGLLEAAQAATYYVATNGAGGDFLSWEQAASNIQDAISKAKTANDLVLVSNGVYQTGGVTNWPSGTILTNRVAITNAITVMSANTNPANTVIKGQFSAGEPGAPGTVTNGAGAVRCVYMMDSSSAKLIGFTLTNGATLTVVEYQLNNSNRRGGGVWCESTAAIISNCVIAGNSANGSGGGAYYGTFYNCTLSGNKGTDNCVGGVAQNANMYNCLLTGNTAASAGATYYCNLYNCTLSGNSAAGGSGGAVGGGTLYNCLLTGNSAATGGGAYNADTRMYNCTIVSNSATTAGGMSAGVLYNCIVYFNYATSGSNWSGTVSFTNCCTAPTATVWAAGNITDNPMFADTNTADYHLAANSPCIDKGTNYSWMTNSANVHSKDLDGRTRIRYGTVDMGAYERINDGTIYKLW